jgi:sterol desaturase/sphingolipid hydroxylase (fatty acid hydroxylase superfamily)
MMKTEQLLGLLIPIAFLFMCLFESRVQARVYRQESKWVLRGVSFLVLTLLIGGLFPMLIQLEKWRPSTWFGLGEHDLLGIPIGLAITSLLSYWLHRAQHRWNWLWKLTHQLHHRPKRVDMLGAFYAHPLEILLKVSLAGLVSQILLGVSPLASASIGLIMALLSQFQHWNIHTPRWLGAVVQRPESHALHHAAVIEVKNFSELPVWDMVFGTYANPDCFDGEVGLAIPNQGADTANE